MKTTRTAVLRLKQLVALADQRAERASTALAQSREAMRASEQRLELLEAYRQQHFDHRRITPGQPIAIEALGNADRFLDKLDVARAQQGVEVERHVEQVAHRQDAWRNEQRRAQSFATLETRAQSHVDADERRREQRTLDDIAQRTTPKLED